MRSPSEPWAAERLYESYELAEPLTQRPMSPISELTVDPRPSRRLRLSLVLPTLLVVAGSAGFASLFFGWMLSHKTQASLSAVWDDGAFVLDEGSKLEGGHDAARLLALTIASAASQVIALTTPVLMGLFAFRVAHGWLLQMSLVDANCDANLPTPLQYGLLLRLLGGSSLGSILTTTRYVLRSPGRRAKVTSLLKQALLMTAVVYTMVHAIGVFDIWLHAVTSSTLLVKTIPVDTPFQFSVAQNTCSPYPPDAIPNTLLRCMYSQGEWGDGYRSLAPGMLVNANTSGTLQTITLADANDLAILVDPSAPLDVQFTATTFGARTICESINHLCHYPDNSSCDGFPSSFPPVTVQDTNGTAEVIPQGSYVAYIVTTDCANCTYRVAEEQVAGTYNPYNKPLNPQPALLQFLWQSDGGTLVNDANDATTPSGELATMLANCSLAFYNVTVSYSNGTYALLDEELCNTGLSDGFAGPTRLNHFSTTLISDISGHVFSDNTTDSVIAFLSQDFARLALGSAAVITNLKADTLTQSRLVQLIAGRYPFWPVVLFTASLYAHAALALGIFVWTAVGSRAYAVRVRGPVTGEDDGTNRTETSVSALELVHLRLTDPLALVADMLPAHAEERAAPLSTQADALDMFAEGRGTTPGARVCVGLHGAKPGAAAAFGLWYRGTGREGTAADTDEGTATPKET